jgi:hypothetical protein
MGAQRFLIEGKKRDDPIAFVSLDDFHYREGDDIDPAVVVQQPTISLYCLDHDHRRAIFVETPSSVDLSQAPFYYQAQYQAAQQLIAVSYETLHQLAGGVLIDPRRIILVYSVGRCGSTLVSHALNQADGVFSFSEPDVYSQLVALREADGSNNAEISRLVRSCTRLICASARSGGASAWVLKLRSFGIELDDLLYGHFPEAKVIFLYRNAEGFARSVVRAFRLLEPEMQAALPRLQRFFSQLDPLIRSYTATHTTTISPIELIACLWVSVMTRCLALQHQGVAMLAARYEELKVAPRDVLDAIVSYCDLSISDPAKLDRILAQDSQAGTILSQATVQQSTMVLAKQHLTELNRLIRQYAPILTADFIMPNTFLPGHTYT